MESYPKRYPDTEDFPHAVAVLPTANPPRLSIRLAPDDGELFNELKELAEQQGICRDADFFRGDYLIITYFETLDQIRPILAKLRAYNLVDQLDTHPRDGAYRVKYLGNKVPHALLVEQCKNAISGEKNLSL